MKKELLMPYEQTRKLGFKIPYYFRLKKDNQYIFYFGARHSFDMSDKQFELIDTEWQNFLKATEGTKRIVFIEGNMPQDVDCSKERGVSEMSEGRYVACLAKEAGVDYLSPEPPAHDEVVKLLENFTKEEIELYYFLRVAHQYTLMQDKPKFEKYITGFLKQDKEDAGWEDFDFSLDNLKRIYRKIIGKDFDIENTKDFSPEVRPDKTRHKSNEVARESGMIRDSYIIDKIEEYWKRDYSIFLIYGATHAVIQESALKQLVSKN